MRAATFSAERNSETSGTRLDVSNEKSAHTDTVDAAQAVAVESNYTVQQQDDLRAMVMFKYSS